VPTNSDTPPYAGVPSWLAHPLHQWAYQFLTPELQQRVALKMRIPVSRPELQEALNHIKGRGAPHLLDHLHGDNLLQGINLALQLDNVLHTELEEITQVRELLRHRPDIRPPAELPPRYRAALQLKQILEDGGSAYTVNVHWPERTQLTTRVDPTITHAATQTMANADPTTGQLLRDAWNHAYGINPDPTAAYREAVRAVEQIAGPLVLPNNHKPSLGTVRKHLLDAHSKWEFVLVDDRGNGTVEPLVALMERLWNGQVSRHGGGPGNRDQTLGEGQAAVHLAATLVQLLATSALTPVTKL
jgi:hypothetical protein